MIAIIGSGPTALMAAQRLVLAGQAVTVFEKRKSPGRKLLIAGSSGLNVTNSLPLDEFIAHYTRDGARPGERKFWNRVIAAFPPTAWLRFLEDLGFPTFEGTSGRHFIEDMKASRMLQAWVARLTAAGAKWEFDQECLGFETQGSQVALEFASGKRSFTAVGFALGGASWEPHETPLRWPELFQKRGVEFIPFAPSNVGYEIAWPAAFLAEAEGKPLKRVVMKTSRGEREGDAMITRYGIEGTPVYFTGRTGAATLDLRPDLSTETITEKLRSIPENLSPIRRIGRVMGLCPASFALLFHCAPREWMTDRSWERWAARIKAFPLTLGAPRPLAEAISSSGGVSLREVTEDFGLRGHPGVFLAGEMLDWDAPTGGFLLQACVAQGALMGDGIARYIEDKTHAAR